MGALMDEHLSFAIKNNAVVNDLVYMFSQIYTNTGIFLDTFLEVNYWVTTYLQSKFQTAFIAFIKTYQIILLHLTDTLSEP